MLELELAGISFHAGKNFGWLEADLRPENAAGPVFRALRPRKPDRFYEMEDSGFLRGGYFSAGAIPEKGRHTRASMRAPVSSEKTCMNRAGTSTCTSMPSKISAKPGTLAWMRKIFPPSPSSGT